MAARGPDWATWVDRLRGTVRDLLDEWELSTDGAMMHGFVGLVVPVRTADGAAAAMKISFPDEESEHEHLALQRWGGRGAVRLLKADPHRAAMLLDRVGPDRLTDTWDIEACEIVAGLYAQLHVPALPQLRLLTSYVDRWTNELAALRPAAPLPRRLVEQAVSLGRDLVADEASTGTLIHADLHYENVMAHGAAEGRGWLAIDPKPLSGDSHYEPAPMLWNRVEELHGDLRRGVRRRFHALVDTAGLDEDRARDWVIVRMLHNCLWAIQDDPGLEQDLNRQRITTCIAAAKAVQD